MAKRFNTVFSLLVALSVASPAYSEDNPSKDGDKSNASTVPQVPGDDIFGFSSPTDVGNVGDTQIANETLAAFGKRAGTYGSASNKTELSRTMAPNLWWAVSFFNTGTHAHNVPGIARNTNNLQFDGLSTEIQYRILERSVSNPFAISLSTEPRWARVDALTGQQLNSFTGEVKAYVDAVVVPDKLYWVLNFNFAPQTEQDLSRKSKWVSTAATNVSTGLTYEVSPNLHVGGEVRYLTAFNRPFLGKETGQAIYIGPNFNYKFTDKIALMMAWTPQAYGKSKTSHDKNLDLDNFERSQYRVRFVYQF